MERLNVYSIIVTYNAMKWIDKCLISLRNSTINTHLIIIDNCSGDNTVEHIKQNYPEAYLIINNVNKGFGQANNQGIEYAYNKGATHFFLLNQDAWVNENSIEILIKTQDQYNIDLLSPIHLNGEGKLFDYNFFMYSVASEKNINYVSDLVRNDLKPWYKVSRINAAAWMLPIKTIEKIGGFDPIFFHYGEDMNYCQRVTYQNGVIAFTPHSIIHHDRENRGYSETYNNLATFARLLTLYADINVGIYRINKNRIKFHVSNLIVSVKLFLKFKVKQLGYLVSNYIKFLLLFPKIVNSIKINKEIGSNWLKI